MTNDELERAIQFLTQHHAKVSAQSDRNFEQIKLHSEQIAQLLRVVSLHSEQIKTMASQAEADRAEMRDAVTEMREGFNGLIVANELTRELAEEVAKLALATGRRVADLER